MGEKAENVAVTAEMVKELRERTGAGVMDCKHALQETGGDMAEARDWLREHGVARAERRSGRATAEGTMGCYVHAGGKIGVLVEVNCETDFVARTPEFQDFAHQVAMQVAAQHPQYLRREDVPEAVIEKEKSFYRAEVEQAEKPPQVVERIVEGKLDRFFQDVCLLEQPFIRDPDKTVEELMKEVAAKVGENMRIRRFVRFQVGEAIEDEQGGGAGGAAEV
jgi:elongation factor Ts